MATLIFSLVSLIVGFGLGFYAAMKNKDSAKVAKAQSIIDQIRK